VVGIGRPLTGQGSRQRALAILVAGALAAACATSQEKAEEVRRDVLSTAEQVRAGPQAAPARSFTSFTPALRCMDNLMIDYGVKGVTALVEDLHDATKKVNAGTRDMMMSAVSDMTRRSGAVRVVAYGADSANTIGFLKESERKTAFANVPDYGIRGSISQLDENLARRTDNVGVQLGPVGGGRANLGTAQVLAVDLAMIRTEDLSLVPGVASRNSVVIVRQGQGIDANASGTWHSQGLSLSFERGLEKNEGTAQALRSLIELAAVELFGRLLKIPYWTCLGADPLGEAVTNEITDWYYGLYGNQASLVTYFQWQLKVRGVYEGEIDGEPNESLRDAVSAYRKALGLDPSARLDQDFLAAYLRANHAATGGVARGILASMPRAPVAAKPVAPMAPLAPLAEPPLELRLSGNSENWLFARGEEIRLAIGVNRLAHLACYSQDETGAVTRFYPNRFVPAAPLAPGATLQIPGAMPFKLVANRRGLKERILCAASARDILGELPSKVVGTDFDRLPVQSIDEVARVFEGLGERAVAVRMVDVLVR
jgi:hypothetical protein